MMKRAETSSDATSTKRRWLWMAIAGLIMWGCGDLGPAMTGSATLAVAPSFRSGGIGVVDVAQVRIRVLRADSATVVVDTVVALEQLEGEGSNGGALVAAAVEVPLESDPETLFLELFVQSATGETVFKGGPVMVTVGTSSEAPPSEIVVDYVGVGAEAEAVRIGPETPRVAPGGIVMLQAVALNEGGQVLAGTPIVWSALDPGVASVPNRDVGLVQAGSIEGTARIVAALLTGPADTVEVEVQSAQAAIGLSTDSVGFVTSTGGASPPLVSISITNAGDPTTTLAAMGVGLVSYDPGGPNGWLSTVSLSSPFAPATLLLGVSTAGLDPGTYLARVPVTAATASNSPQMIAVTLSVVGPSSVVLTPAAVSLQSLGATSQMNATAFDAMGNSLPGQVFTWVTTNANVASVDGNGRVTAVANGNATITATAHGVTGSATVNVAQRVTAVTVAPGGTSFGAIGDSIQLQATPEDATGNEVPQQQVAWTTSNPSVASVSPNGVVRAVGEGLTTITATVAGVTGTASVSVTPGVATVSVTPTAGALDALGRTLTMTATARDANGNPLPAVVLWASLTPGVASVSPTGVVTAVGNGVATITASAGGVVGNASVTVVQQPTSVTVTPAATTLSAVGQTLQLLATARDANGNPVLGQPFGWSSSNPAVASVSATGLVTAGMAGTVTITATAGAASGSATVTVLPTVQSITVTPGAATLNALGQTVVLSAVARDANGNPLAGQVFTWITSNAAVATVTGSGAVTGVGNGLATITVSAGGVTATAAITVQQIVASVSVTPTSVVFSSAGATRQLTAVAQDANGSVMTGQTVFWSSSNQGVATVNSSGLVTSVGEGTAVVTAAVGAISGAASVTYSQLVAAVTVTPPAATLTALGQTVQLNAFPVDANENPVNVPITWQSSNPAIATVSPSGLVTAVSSAPSSPVTITATADGVPGTAIITVDQIAASIEVLPALATLDAINATLQMSATVRDANGNVMFSGNCLNGWSVVLDEVTVATVNANCGLVTAQQNGTAVIIGEVDPSGETSSLADTAFVTVSQTVASVAITPSPIPTLNFIGDIENLTATAFDRLGTPVFDATFTWTVDPAVFGLIPGSFSSDVMITAVANGSGIVEATGTGGVGGVASDAETVTVQQVIAFLDIEPNVVPPLTAFGNTFQMTATAQDSGSAPMPVVWSSANAGVATVDQTGLVTAVANGNSQIIIMSGGLQDENTITVAQAPFSVTVAPPGDTLDAIGATVQLSAAAFDANANPIVGQAITWSSSNPAVATVTQAGLVSAVDNTPFSPVTITATADSVSGTSAVTVAQIVDPAASTASVPTSTIAGTSTTIDVLPRDRLGNPILFVGGFNVVITITGANPQIPPVSETSGGTYTASYTPGVSGTDIITITLNGLPIQGSPFTNTIGVGTAATLEFSVQPAQNITAGVNFAPAIQVTARDALGNIATGFTGTVTLGITPGTGPPGALLTGGTAVTAVSGVATFPAVQVDSAGVGYRLTASATGPSSVVSAAFIVVPGPADPARSSVVVNPATVTQFSPVNFTVTARDALGNPLTVGGETVVINISGANSAVPPVTDNGDGTYTASYTPTVSGNDNVAITMNGTAISGSPIVVVVLPGGDPDRD